jgi:hypothetical protein
MGAQKLYNSKFEDLFSSKENAVILYLSLERRHGEVVRELKKFREHVELHMETKIGKKHH